MRAARFYLKAWLRALPGEAGFSAVALIGLMVLQLWTGGPGFSGDDGANLIAGSWLALTAFLAAGSVALEALAWHRTVRRVEREHGKSFREVMDEARRRGPG